MRRAGSSSTASRCAPTSPRGRLTASPPEKLSATMEIRDPDEMREDAPESEGLSSGEVEVLVAEPMPSVERVFEEIDIDAPQVGIIMGSKNDKEKMQPAGHALMEAEIRYEVRV